MNQFNIDVHIGVHPLYDRSESLDKLLSKLKDEPVNVHLVPGVLGCIGAMRFAGFSAGTAPLQSYIDDDDDFPSGIFSKMERLFELEPEIDAACTSENGEHSHPFKYYDRRHVFRTHHLAMFRRAAIAPHIAKIKDFADGSEHGIWMQLLLGGARVRHLPVNGYTWRIHAQDSKSLKLVKDPLYFQWYKDLMAMAQSENFVSHLDGGNRHINRGDIIFAETLHKDTLR